MKNYFTPIALSIAACISLPSFAQKTEVHLSLNSGLSSFNGPSATRTDRITVNANRYVPYETRPNAYTSNTVGKIPEFSYGASGQIQRVTSRSFIFGIGLGYENLRSSVRVDKVIFTQNITPISEAATGKIILSNQFLNVFSYLGYRIKMNEILLDLTTGVDVGYLMNSREEGKAKTVTDYIITTYYNRDWDIDFDVRAKLQATVSYHRFGIYADYAQGIPNYYGEMDCGDSEARSRMVRLGVTYKIKG